jgi:hypothetical protein
MQIEPMKLIHYLTNLPLNYPKNLILQTEPSTNKHHRKTNNEQIKIEHVHKRQLK